MHGDYHEQKCTFGNVQTDFMIFIFVTEASGF